MNRTNELSNAKDLKKRMREFVEMRDELTMKIELIKIFLKYVPEEEELKEKKDE